MQSGGFFTGSLGNLVKKALTNVVIPFARNHVPG